MGFDFNKADIWFNPEILFFDLLVFNSALFEF